MMEQLSDYAKNFYNQHFGITADQATAKEAEVATQAAALESEKQSIRDQIANHDTAKAELQAKLDSLEQPQG